MKLYAVGLFISVPAFVVLLSGCASTFNSKTGAFRNREFDYLHQPVVVQPALITPKGIPAPTLSPRNTIPQGPNYYAPKPSVLLTPPGFDTVVSEPKTTPTPAVHKGFFDFLTHDSEKAELNQKIQALRSQLSTLKNNQEGSLAKEKTAIPQFHFSSHLNFDDQNQGLLTVDAPFQSVWNALGALLPALGYSITDSNAQKGTLNLKISTQSLFLFVNHHESSTQISVFDQNGKLDSSTEAYRLLSEIQARFS